MLGVTAECFSLVVLVCRKLVKITKVFLSSFQLGVGLHFEYPKLDSFGI